MFKTQSEARRAAITFLILQTPIAAAVWWFSGTVPLIGR